MIITKISSTSLEIAVQILHLVTKVDILHIDEAQFFDEGIVDVCNLLANDGIRLIVAGLDMNFRRRPFGPILQLKAIAEYMTKMHAICVRTGDSGSLYSP